MSNSKTPSAEKTFEAESNGENPPRYRPVIVNPDGSRRPVGGYNHPTPEDAKKKAEIESYYG